MSLASTIKFRRYHGVKILEVDQHIYILEINSFKNIRFVHHILYVIIDIQYWQ